MKCSDVTAVCKAMLRFIIQTELKGGQRSSSVFLVFVLVDINVVHVKHAMCFIYPYLITLTELI